MSLDIKDFEAYNFLWNNNGKFSDEAVENLPEGWQKKKEYELMDALSVPDASSLMPKVISNIVKEAQEPLLIGTSLLQRINFTYGQTITFPAVGALVAADIPEGGEYPERRLQQGGATVTATIGKSGVAVKITDEMIRYSQFDVIGMHLRAAGRALARHKERKIFNYINNMGNVAFNNSTPTSSVYGPTTGRDITGAANGSLTLDDVFDTYGLLLNNGFTPNTLLMHPLTWVMFVKDPTLRAFALANGGGTFFASWTGSPAGTAPWDNSGQGGLGYSSGQNIVPGGSADGSTASILAAYSQTIKSAPQLPNYFQIPFRILVSPFVPYNPTTQLTDIMMFDSNELGVLIVDEDVVVEEFDDPKVDIRKIKLRERYGIGILNEGNGIAVLKDVHVVPNEIVLPAQAQQDVYGQINTIPNNVAVV